MLVLPARDWHRGEDGAKARRAPALAGKTHSARTGSARPAGRRTTRPHARWRRRARPGVAGARQIESSLLIRAQRAAIMTSDPTQQASMTSKPPGEPLAPRTTDQNTHSGAKALINSSKSEAHLSADQARSRLRRAATFRYRPAVVGPAVTICAPPDPNGATWKPSTPSAWPSAAFMTSWVPWYSCQRHQSSDSRSCVVQDTTTPALLSGASRAATGSTAGTLRRAGTADGAGRSGGA